MLKVGALTHVVVLDTPHLFDWYASPRPLDSETSSASINSLFVSSKILDLI